jgi:hypothetical protein
MSSGTCRISVLANGDEVQIGTFRLMFLAAAQPSGQVHFGRSTALVPVRPR